MYESEQTGDKMDIKRYISIATDQYPEASEELTEKLCLYFEEHEKKYIANARLITDEFDEEEKVMSEAINLFLSDYCQCDITI